MNILLNFNNEKLLNRSLRKQENLIVLHKGNEKKNLTYLAGYDKGYWDGRVTILDDIIDDIKNI